MSKSSGTFCSQIKTQDESVTLSRSQSLILELAHALATSLRYSEGDAITHPLPNAVAQMAGAHILAVKELKSTFLLHLDKRRGEKAWESTCCFGAGLLEMISWFGEALGNLWFGPKVGIVNSGLICLLFFFFKSSLFDALLDCYTAPKGLSSVILPGEYRFLGRTLQKEESLPVSSWSNGVLMETTTQKTFLLSAHGCTQSMANFKVV